MALNIKHEKAHDLARTLAHRRGTTMTQAVVDALAEALERTPPAASPKLERLREISARSAALAVLDDRPADEILGYDSEGMPR